MRHLFGETVTRVRAAAILDPYSQEETGLDWDDTAELAIPRCAVDPSKTRETFDTNRNAVVTDFAVWTDDVYDITAADRLVIRGLKCQIVGRPAIWTNPFNGETPGMEIFANVWEG
jgi:head-tail adaptor